MDILKQSSSIEIEMINITILARVAEKWIDVDNVKLCKYFFQGYTKLSLITCFHKDLHASHAHRYLQGSDGLTNLCIDIGCFNALFTFLVGWHSVAVSLPPGDVTFA